MSVCMAVVASAAGFQVEGISYSIVDATEQTVTVTGWNPNYFKSLAGPSNPNVGSDDEEAYGPVDLVLPWRVYNSNDGLYYRLIGIEDYAFSNCVSLNSVVIPNSVTFIGTYAFESCTNLKTVKVQWTKPLEIDASVFDNIDLKGNDDDPNSGVTLCVLTGYRDTYKATDVWKDFHYVNEYSDLDVNIIFSDPKVKELAVESWDSNGDGELSYREARAVTDIGAVFMNQPEIETFTEFRLFNHVTSVEAQAFKGCAKLTAINIPTSVTSIGNNAFEGCEMLTNLSLPKTGALISIGNYAFAGCAKMLGLTLPDNLKTIGMHAFDGCASITSINVPSYVTSIGEGAFANCSSNKMLNVSSVNKTYVHYMATYILDKATKTTILAYASGASAKEFTIPATVKTVAPYAFAGSNNITKIDLGSVETIGNNAFENMSGLQRLVIPETLPVIPEEAFANCKNLYTLKIPTTVTTIEQGAFKGMPRGIRAEVYWTTPIAINDGTFSNFDTETVTGVNGRLFVPKGTKDSYATATGWKWFSFIEEGTIDDYAEKIIDFADSKTRDVCVGAFDADNDGYVTYDEAAAVTSLGNAFKGADLGSFDEFKYFTGVTAIEDDAFNGSTLTSITLHDNIISVGENAFAYCNNLTTFTFPKSVEYIGNGVLKSCAKLTAINVAADNEFYDSGTSNVLFNKDHSVLVQYPANKASTGVTIPDKVYTVAPGAFEGAANLKTVTISNSVTSIGEKAFANCKVLQGVKVEWATPLAVPENCFEGVDVANAKLTVPQGLEEDYKAASVWKDFGTYETFKKYIIFADENTEKVCVSKWDTNKDGKLSYEEAEVVTDLGTAFMGHEEIISFDELNYFTALTTISANAFKGCSSLEKITIPSKVTSIGESAFEGCSVMKAPTSSAKLTSYGKKAFYGCDALTSVTIASTVTYLGPGAFGNCASLTKFTVNASNKIYRSISNIIFTADTSTVVAYPAGATTKTFKITKDYIKNIYPYAFSGASKITSIDLHMVDNIEEYAFEKCTMLSKVEFSQYVKTIGEGAFSNCESLQSIIIPDNVTSIGAKAFEGMPVAVRCQVTRTTPLEIAAGTFSNIEEPAEGQIKGILFVPEGTRDLYAAAPGWDFFSNIVEGSMSDYDASLITFADPLVQQLAVENWDTDGDNQLSYTEAEKVTSIGTVFSEQPISSFNELKFFTALTQIPDNAFKNTKLNAITMPEGITRIGNSAFQGTAISKWNTLPGLSEIGDSAFAYNTGFTSLTFSANIKKLGVGVFKGCPKLTAINVQAANENYSSVSGVLYDKSGTKLLQYPAAKNVTDFVVGNKVEEIAEDAFTMAGKLKSVTLPASITTIGENAFRACAVLDSVIVSWHTPLAVPANTFEGVDVANATLTVPKGYEEVYKAAPVWKDFGQMSTFLDDSYIIEFEDETVKAICVNNWDTDGDGELSVGEAKAVKSLGTAFAIASDMNIKKFNEFQYFTSITEVPAKAFQNFATLQEITLPKSIKTISGAAFHNCVSLATIEIPAATTSIKDGAFANCSSLQSFTVAQGSKTFVAVDGVVFSADKTNLVVYPAGRKGAYEVPETVTTLTAYAFSGATELTEVRLPKGITALPEGIFNRCASLTFVNIPGSVQTIGSSTNNFAFYECVSLKAIKVAWDTPFVLPASSNMFQKAYPEDVKLYVPVGTKVKYQGANIWNSFKEIIEYPNCDVNADGYADMLDAVDIVKYVVDTPVNTFDPYLADFDDDQYVTVADAVMLVDKIANGKAAPNAQFAPQHFMESEQLLSLTKDVNNVISLCLDSKARYTAFQFDLTLPEGADVQLAQLTSRQNGHQMLYNKIGENTYRFVAISIANHAFNGDQGSVISIMAGNPDCEQISATNIRFVAANGYVEKFDDITASQTTDIAELTSAKAVREDGVYYNLNGMRVDRPGKGVYIVNGKKVIIK